jgi:hypothetical protein
MLRFGGSDSSAPAKAALVDTFPDHKSLPPIAPINADADGLAGALRAENRAR